MGILNVEFPYGRRSLLLQVPESARIARVRATAAPVDPDHEIRQALDHPIGTPLLWQLAAGKPDAVIVINDTTRPAPSVPMLRALLADLARAGIGADHITVVIACGNHRPCTAAEIKEMVGSELAGQLRILNHSCRDRSTLVKVGHTTTGLPVWINKIVAGASLKILTGLISPHPAAGYSGGRKSLLPGVAGIDTLKHHHSFPFRPFAPAYGWMKGNPFHEEAVRIARRAGIDFILNVVQDAQGRVIRAVAGELEAAHEQGVAAGKPYWELDLPHRYDVVVAGPGGYPRDIDLHQAQKAISTAETVCKPGGTIVLVAECPDSAGKWSQWLKEADTPHAVIERFKREGFTENHSSKAFMCARALAKYRVFVACEGIPAAELRAMMFATADSPQAAVDRAIRRAGPDARVLLLPKAVNCVPIIRSDDETEIES